MVNAEMNEMFLSTFSRLYSAKANMHTKNGVGGKTKMRAARLGLGFETDKE